MGSRSCRGGADESSYQHIAFVLIDWGIFTISSHKPSDSDCRVPLLNIRYAAVTCSKAQVGRV